MPSPILLNISNNISVKEVPIVGEKFLIGRGLHNGFVVEDVNVSRTHCALEQEGNIWILMDKSSNGTWLNGKLVDKSQKNKLSTGDIIGLNNTVKFVFKIIGDEMDEQDYTSEANHLSQDHNYAQTVGPANNFEKTSEGPKVEGILPSSSSQSNEPNFEPTTDQDQKSQPNNLDCMEDELQCSICAELFVQAVTLSCSHTFCSFCIMQWKKTKSICPICRSKITSVCPTRVIDGFIDKVLETADEETKRMRREMIEQRQALLAPPTSTKPSNSASTSTRSAASAHSASSSVASTSTASARRTAPATRSTASARTTAPIEISSDEDNTEEANDEDDSMSDYSGSDWDRDYGDDDWFDDYNGLPGQYYGGYGQCFSCGQRGHWSNGCPNKRR